MLVRLKTCGTTVQHGCETETLWDTVQHGGETESLWDAVQHGGETETLCDTVPHGSETENLWDTVQCGSETFAVYVFPFQGVRDMLKVFLEKCQEIDKLGSKSISFLPQLNIISEVCLLHRT